MNLDFKNNNNQAHSNQKMGYYGLAKKLNSKQTSILSLRIGLLADQIVMPEAIMILITIMEQLVVVHPSWVTIIDLVTMRMKMIAAWDFNSTCIPNKKSIWNHLLVAPINMKMWQLNLSLALAIHQIQKVKLRWASITIIIKICWEKIQNDLKRLLPLYLTRNLQTDKARVEWIKKDQWTLNLA